ncbi:hypothetical protein L6452_35004 [Arctium lappa]|uniref:Uncharacterized protein n=1 Tax=Arctium lappa TaxID=4217 RepID=A0ACB8YJU5_ARCLA|nr:hypothetical protein L6452_35004 [Arctium lappa]
MSPEVGKKTSHRRQGRKRAAGVKEENQSSEAGSGLRLSRDASIFGISGIIDVVGYSTSVEADCERRTLDPSKEYVFEEDSNGSELDEVIFEGFTEDEDDDDDDEGDEDDDDEDAPSSGR